METLVICLCREHKSCGGKTNQDASQLSISEANKTALIPLMVTSADSVELFRSLDS